jgi:hypothetical protein
MQNNGQNKKYLIIVLSLLSIVCSFSKSKSRDEADAISTLVTVLTVFEKEYKTKVNSFDLDKLRKIADIEGLDMRFTHKGLPSFYEGYVFFEEPVTYKINQDGTECTLVLARKAPAEIKNKNEENKSSSSFCRYLIYRDETEKLVFSDLEESAFQKLLIHSSDATKEKFGLIPRKSPSVGSSLPFSSKPNTDIKDSVSDAKLTARSTTQTDVEKRTSWTWLWIVLGLVLSVISWLLYRRTHGKRQMA